MVIRARICRSPRQRTWNSPPVDPPPLLLPEWWLPLQQTPTNPKPCWRRRRHKFKFRKRFIFMTPVSGKVFSLSLSLVLQRTGNGWRSRSRAAGTSSSSSSSSSSFTFFTRKKRSRQTDIHSFTRVSRSGHLAWIFSLLFLLHRHSFKCRRHFSTMEVAPSQASTFSPRKAEHNLLYTYFCDKDRHTHTHAPSFSLQKWACNNDLFFFSL